MKTVIKCPTCKRRIFDTTDNSLGLIDIKCPHCKQVVQVELKPKPILRFIELKRK